MDKPNRTEQAISWVVVVISIVMIGKKILLTKILISSFKILDFGPVPVTSIRLTPNSLANLRTEGLAWAVENCCSSMGGKAPATFKIGFVGLY